MLVLLYIGVACAALLICLLCIFKKNNKFTRTSSVVLLATILGLQMISLFELLGLPKPHYLEFRDLKDLPVLAARIEEQKAIYLWILTEKEPVAYKLPWSIQRAKELHNAMQQSEQNEGSVYIRKLYDSTPDFDDEIFEVRPPEAPPPKEVP